MPRFYSTSASTVPIVLLAVLALLVGSAVPAAAQNTAVPDWNRTNDPLQSAIGLHYGQLGGHGLSFRVPLRWFLYLQAAGGVWHTDDDKRHNLGLNLNYLLRQDQRTRIYLNFGTGYFYHDERVGTGEDEFAVRKNWNVGGGVGLEYLQGRRWSWKLEANFAHLGRSGDIKVVPQAGIAYYW